jgi:flagellar assembly protein FliH
MSSSKVFKKDLHFTPTPLVRRNILPVRKESKFHPAATPPQSFPDTAVQTPLVEPDDVLLAQGEAKGEPETQLDIEALKQEAYNQGKADLAAQFQMEFQQTLAAFADGCQKIDSQRKKMLQQSRGDLINLIILLSEKILGQELATPRNIIAATLQSALEQAIESEEYYVTLHPEDLAFAEAKVPEIIADIRGLERIVFKTDNSMIRGGCLLESSFCRVDATIETQLASMREFLANQPIFLPVPEIDAAVPVDRPAEDTNPEA